MLGQNMSPGLFNPCETNRGPVSHPLLGTTYYSTAARLPDDEQATAQTIALMSLLALSDSQSEEVQRAVAQATAGATDAGAKAAGIWQWIRSHVRFIEDKELAAPLSATPEEDEVVVRPAALLRMAQPAGDCDCISTLCASMLLAAGIQPTFRAVEADSRFAGTYSHVYVLAGGLALDCSHGPYAGWEVQARGKSRDWRLPMRYLTLGQLREIDWGSIIQSGVDVGGSILKARLAVPQLKPGQYIQQSGSVLYQQQPGQSALQFPSAVGDSNILLVALVVVGGLGFISVLGRRS